jgi:DNA-binding response OmpR family regulator
MKKVLVIDDDPIMCETIRDILQYENYEVKTAANGYEGITMLASEFFDLVVTDVLMPDKDGIEVILEVKKKYPNVKILAVSGGGYITAEHYLKMACDLGAGASVMKPFDIDVLVNEVNNLLGKTNCAKAS